ncbi:hypothetical protein CXB51_025886 [Gossypium anomalum]|uniref:Uncharacterized protein n=1 Tax=Gossypium anomalum TaxID=47600 RepID=A0A8J5Z4I9_9ROSI|nr:hypothetical protein CXB51_025886 [Gossypium anomalum]
MASGGSKSAATMLLFLNLGLYIIVTIVAGWAVNHAIERTHETASVLSIPARIFPIFFPMGNMATGFFVIFALIAGVVGVSTSVTGLTNVFQWDAPNLNAAAASSLLTWALTLLAMGLKFNNFTKESIRMQRDQHWLDRCQFADIGSDDIIVSGTQLFCTGAIHAGAEDAALNRMPSASAGTV